MFVCYSLVFLFIASLLGREIFTFYYLIDFMSIILSSFYVGFFFVRIIVFMKLLLSRYELFFLCYIVCGLGGGNLVRYCY